jgi:hypothetical protein
MMEGMPRPVQHIPGIHQTSQHFETYRSQPEQAENKSRLTFPEASSNLYGNDTHSSMQSGEIDKPSPR